MCPRGKCTYVVLLLELLGERRAHDDVADARGSGEVGLARLAARRGYVLVELHFY